MFSTSIRNGRSGKLPRNLVAFGRQSPMRNGLSSIRKLLRTKNDMRRFVWLNIELNWESLLILLYFLRKCVIIEMKLVRKRYNIAICFLFFSPFQQKHLILRIKCVLQIRHNKFPCRFPSGLRCRPCIERPVAIWSQSLFRHLAASRSRFAASRKGVRVNQWS